MAFFISGLKWEAADENRPHNRPLTDASAMDPLGLMDFAFYKNLQSIFEYLMFIQSNTILVYNLLEIT